MMGRFQTSPSCRSSGERALLEAQLCLSPLPRRVASGWSGTELMCRERARGPGTASQRHTRAGSLRLRVEGTEEMGRLFTTAGMGELCESTSGISSVKTGHLS